MKKILNALGWVFLGVTGFCALFAIGFFGYALLYDQNPDLVPVPPSPLQQADTAVQAHQDMAGEHCAVTVQSFYTECSHLNTDTIEAPNEYNGKSLEVLLNHYPGSTLESKTDDEIVIKVYKREKCEKHYVAQLRNNKIVVCRQNDPTTVIREIDKPASALSYEDTVLLTQGIYLESGEELTAFLEDYSS